MSELRDAVARMGALVRGKDGTPLHMFFANETVVVTRHQWHAILDLVGAAEESFDYMTLQEFPEIAKARARVMELGREGVMDLEMRYAALRVSAWKAKAALEREVIATEGAVSGEVHYALSVLQMALSGNAGATEHHPAKVPTRPILLKIGRIRTFRPTD